MHAIVVGYDATEPAERALARAAEIAEAFRAKLLVVSVAGIFPAGVPVGGDPLLATAPPLELEPTALPETREAADERLENARTFLAGRTIDVEYLATLGDPRDELIAAADDAGAELIVVGTREPGFLDRLIGGSVSQQVARGAHCDVLIVHPGHGAQDSS